MPNPKDVLTKGLGPRMTGQVGGRAVSADTPSKRGKLIDAVAKNVASKKGGVAKAVRKQKVAEIAKKARY